MRLLLLIVLSGSPAVLNAAGGLSSIERICEYGLAPLHQQAIELHSGFVALPNGTELFVRVEQPRWQEPNSWFLAIHGLLGSHRNFDQLASRLVSRGYGVVRMDLRGFARSLHRQIHNSRSASFSAPERLDYSQQVEDLKLLLQDLRGRLGLGAPRVIGHSMGGAVALALMADPEGAKLTAGHVTEIAPYLYRLEYYLAEKLAFLGWPAPVPLSTMDRFVPNMIKIGPEFVIDSFVTNPHMGRVLGDYFDNVVLQRELSVPGDRLDEVRRYHVQSALAAVKGLRDYDAFEVLNRVPPSVDVDLVYGDNDPLLESELARRFGSRIVQRGGRVQVLRSGHMLPEEVPDHLVEILIGADALPDASARK